MTFCPRVWQLCNITSSTQLQPNGLYQISQISESMNTLPKKKTTWVPENPILREVFFQPQNLRSCYQSQEANWILARGKESIVTSWFVHRIPDIPDERIFHERSSLHPNHKSVSLSNPTESPDRLSKDLWADSGRWIQHLGKQAPWVSVPSPLALLRSPGPPGNCWSTARKWNMGTQGQPTLGGRWGTTTTWWSQNEESSVGKISMRSVCQACRCRVTDIR